MHSTCVHDGAIEFRGVCRACFILYYSNDNQSDAQESESNEEGNKRILIQNLCHKILV